jgi:hypothetical protein
VVNADFAGFALDASARALPLPIIELHFGEQGLESRIAVNIAQQRIDRGCCCHKSHHAASNIIWVNLDLAVG